jgi:hypothetical protein
MSVSHPLGKSTPVHRDCGKRHKYGSAGLSLGPKNKAFRRASAVLASDLLNFLRTSGVVLPAADFRNKPKLRMVTM